ncbi:uncharacterized protein LOC130455546 isoform X2 [Monodelphis domestica]|nr:uncharacterized protein LOC130455546 isoform X2 [Monodelphis domestica]
MELVFHAMDVFSQMPTHRHSEGTDSGLAEAARYREPDATCARQVKPLSAPLDLFPPFKTVGNSPAPRAQGLWGQQRPPDQQICFKPRPHGHHGRKTLVKTGRLSHHHQQQTSIYFYQVHVIANLHRSFPKLQDPNCLPSSPPSPLPEGASHSVGLYMDYGAKHFHLAHGCKRIGTQQNPK